MATVESSATTLRIPLSPFRNEPATDFRNPENARRMREALTKVRAELGREYDMVVGNRLVKTEHKIKSLNPAHPSEIVGITQEAGREHAAVLRYVAKGDGAAARRALEKHILHTRDRLAAYAQTIVANG